MAPLPTVTPPLSSSSTSSTSATASPASPTPQHSLRSKYLHHFTSGFGSGAVSAFLLQPADLLKTRLQQAPTSATNGAPATLTTTLRAILAGPKPIPTLWRGAVPSVVRTSVGSALYFTTLTVVRDQLATPKQHTMSAAAHDKGTHSSVLVQLSPTSNILAGAFSRASVGFIMMPVTIIKVRFESDLYAYRSLTGATGSILRHEGIAGFFRGWGATAVRDAPYAGLYLLFYEAGKKSLSKLFMTDEAKRENRSLGVNMTASALAATAATTVTNPFDMLKTRLQVLPGDYKNMWVAFGRVIKEEGVTRLFDGLTLRIGRKAVSSALVWSTYEFLISGTKGEKGSKL